jgi:iron complex outermembrane receptor protein
MRLRQLAVVFLGLLAAHGLAAPGASGQADPPVGAEPTATTEADTVAVPLQLAVISAGGGVPANLRSSLRDSMGTELKLRTVSSDPARFHAVLRGGGRYELFVEADGHLARRVELLAPDSGPLSRVVVLELDPIVLPELSAVVPWQPGDYGSDRAVSAVRFAEAPIAWTGVGEWLSTQPGVSLRGSMTAGGQTVSVRGSRPEGVLVLLDGHPVNDPMTGSADLSSVSIASLESATLVRGAGSARHGSGALAGVLLLRSRQPRGSAASGAVRVSSFGGVGGEFQVSRSGSAGRAALSLSWDEIRNDFEYQNRVLPDAPVETRVNADGSRLSAAVGAARGKMHIDVRYDGVERGSPGPMGSAVFDQARWSNQRATVAAGIQGRSTGLSVRAGWLGTRWDSGLASAAAERDGIDGALLLNGNTGGALALLVRGRLSYEALRGDDIKGTATRAVFGTSVARSFDHGRLRIDPALSVDGTADQLVVSPEVGLTMAAGAGVTVRARAGQAFRLPTLGDLYFAPALRVRSNPDLDPERVVFDSELGLRGQWRPGQFELEADIGAWYRTTNDPIVWLASAAAVWSPRNLDRLVSTGVEASIRASTAGSESAGWRMSAAASIDRSRLGYGDNQNPMPYRPGTTGSLGLERWSRGFTARTMIRWTGSRTTSVAGTRSLPGFLLLDVALAQALPIASLPLEIEGRVDNLLDRRYEMVELYPEPGRRYSLTLRLR